MKRGIALALLGLAAAGGGGLYLAPAEALPPWDPADPLLYGRPDDLFSTPATPCPVRRRKTAAQKRKKAERQRRKKSRA